MERFRLILLYLFHAASRGERFENMSQRRTATLVRMALPDHVCPYGLRAKDLLEQHGFEIEERILKSRDEVEAYKDEQGVRTTPQIFVDDERIGGCDALERWLPASVG
jgi:glutaredoxin